MPEDTDLPARRRGSEELWLEGAYELLTEAGVEAVKVMALARRLGQTRTSFYWHFRDRDALLEAMIRHWEEKNTGNLVDRCEAYADSITEAIFNLFDCWLNDDLFDAPLDLAIRNWARTDPALQARLDRADAARIAAVTAMFRRFGYSQDQASVRARTVIYTQTGYYSMQISESREARVARMPDYAEVFTGRTPTKAEIRRLQSRHEGVP